MRSCLFARRKKCEIFDVLKLPIMVLCCTSKTDLCFSWGRFVDIYLFFACHRRRHVRSFRARLIRLICFTELITFVAFFKKPTLYVQRTGRLFLIKTFDEHLRKMSALFRSTLRIYEYTKISLTFLKIFFFFSTFYYYRFVLKFHFEICR